MGSNLASMNLDRGSPPIRPKMLDELESVYYAGRLYSLFFIGHDIPDCAIGEIFAQVHFSLLILPT